MNLVESHIASLFGLQLPPPLALFLTAREVRNGLEVEAERGLAALVVRELEMPALWDCFEKARAGQGQMVFIVGEPGIASPIWLN